MNTGKNYYDLTAKPTNACKPTINPKTKLKRPQITNKQLPGVGNPLLKLEAPIEKRVTIPKSQTTACIVTKTKPRIDRPITLTLKKTEKYKLSLNKANQSLPESPVCEELKVFKEQCKRDMGRFSSLAQKRRSCSYFIGLNDNQETMENIAKSFESLPAMESNVLDEENDNDDNGNFSDDSLESDFKNPPRRCISDYQINIRVDNSNQVNSHDLHQKTITRSQESILSDVSIDDFSKGSAEVLDSALNMENDRHSSASFFLSRRRMQSGRSQESILTDESDYQMFPLREDADHRSTESVLTDDSDSMVKSAPLEMLFDSHYKRRRQRSENFDTVEEETSCSNQVFRSKSLQDTSLQMIQNAEAEAAARSRIFYEISANDMNRNLDGMSKQDVGRNLKMPRAPQSMLIVNDFVAHKPPKPKRNSCRTQSMRNRIRPGWNKCNVDPESNSNFDDQSYRKYQTLPSRQNEESHFSDMKQSYDGNQFYSLQIQENSNQENSVVNKETESYDSLEGQQEEKQQMSVDVRMTRAIEGTVKLLSQEFENLVRREQYFANCKLKQDHFAKLEAERDTRCAILKRDGRGHSGGEDSEDRSMFESSSSTPLSSGTNSPKRMWPPASRCHSQMKWTRTLPTISQSILPSKQYITGS